MLSVILAIISVAVAITFIRFFVYQDEKPNVIRGHALFIYGPRCGYTDIISDMLARFANNELCNSNLTRWKVLHQSDYYKPEHVVKMIPQCCGVVNYNPINNPTDTKYSNYVNYENVKSLNLRMLMDDIESYTSDGINVIIEGHIHLTHCGNLVGSPVIYVTQSNESLVKSSKFRADISECVDDGDEIRYKIIEKYVGPAQGVVEQLFMENVKSVKCFNIDDNQFNVISELYSAIKNIFIKIQKQDDIREYDTAYTPPSIM